MHMKFTLKLFRFIRENLINHFFDFVKPQSRSRWRIQLWAKESSGFMLGGLSVIPWAASEGFISSDQSALNPFVLLINL